MAEIENNLINIRGVRPGYDMDSLREYPRMPSAGIQVAASADIDNGTVIIHTVTAGKTLYLCHYMWSIWNISGGNGWGRLQVRDAGDAQVYLIVDSGAADDFAYGISGNFNPPLEVPAGYDICVISGQADCWVSGFIHGYEI